jgi:hypothetical protein
VSIDEQHIALPKLYGAPAYARPSAPVEDAARPFDPDDLPIEAFRTDHEREFVSSLPEGVWSPGGAILTRSGSTAGSMAEGQRLMPRKLDLRAIAGRLINSD